MVVQEYYITKTRVRAVTMKKHRAVNGLNVQPSLFLWSERNAKETRQKKRVRNEYCAAAE